MKDILLPKGIKKLKDKSGKEVDYDISVPVFSPGSEAGILEQLVLSLYFRGGEAVIERPYVVRLVEQPLTKFFINQLCIWHISKENIDSLESAAEYVASEHVLVAPNVLSGKASELQKKFEILKKYLHRDTHEATSKEIQEIADTLEQTITPCTTYMDARVIAILHNFQRTYKKPDNPKLAVILDMYRRIVDKSLQGTQNSSMTTIAKLVEQFENNPTIQNARLVDIFARQHNALGFKEDRNLMYTKVRNVYLPCVTSKFAIEDRVSSYASLIIFESLLGLTKEAALHVHELKNLTIPKDNVRINHLRNIFLSKGEGKKVNGTISKLGVVGLEKYYHPDLLKILYTRLKEYEKKDGVSTTVSDPIDLMESLMEHAKLTKLYDIFYEKESGGSVYRNMVFNHNPYLKICDQLSYDATDDLYILKQKMDAHYFGVLEKMLKPVRNYLKHGRVFGEPEIADFFSSDVDKYLFAMPNIRQTSYLPGSSMIATLPTKPRLQRLGPNGHGPIDSERYTELQKS